MERLNGMKAPANISLSCCDRRCKRNRLDTYSYGKSTGEVDREERGKFRDWVTSVGRGRSQWRPACGREGDARGCLVSEVEVDAGGEAEAVLDVFGAVGESGVNQIHLHEAEIEAVIDVEIHAAAGFEVE